MDQPQAKYFFLQLGIIVALYTAVASFITFSFDIINYIFPDRQAGFFDPFSTGMRFSISTLIVVFPVLIYLSRMMFKNLMAAPQNRDLPVRRWLSYLTLFIAGIVIIGDIITLINTFLNGEISPRFITKVALILIVSFGVFWYTIRDLKGVYYEKPHLLKLFTIIASVIVIGSLVAGLIIVGSPAKQRKLRDDQTRVGHLQSIQWNVVSYYQQSGKLPETLDQLSDPLYPEMKEQFLDPETKEKYEYRTVASTTPSFELCANFALQSMDDYYKGRGIFPSRDIAVSYPYPGEFNQVFTHNAGRNCFSRSIDPIRNPIYPKGEATMPMTR